MQSAECRMKNEEWGANTGSPKRRAHSSLRRPLIPAFSPGYRGEGAGARWRYLSPWRHELGVDITVTGDAAYDAGSFRILHSALCTLHSSLFILHLPPMPTIDLQLSC